MTAVNRNLAQLMMQHRMTQAELEAASGVPQSTISRILSGRTPNPKLETLQALAKALDVSVATLASEAAPPTPPPTRTRPGAEVVVELEPGNIASKPRPIVAWDPEDPVHDDEVEVPRLALKLSAGHGRLQWEIDAQGTPNRFRLAWCQRNGLRAEKLVTVVVEGDSMLPTIPPDAVITLNTDATAIRNGRIHAIDYLGEFFIKRLFKEPDGSIRIVSDHPDKSRYRDIVVRPEHAESLRILGLPVNMSVNMIGM